MSYQWQQFSGGSWVSVADAGRISGSQTDTLTITGTVTTDDATYRCWLNNGYEMDTYTDPATLTVDLAPVIDSQPSSDVILQGNNAVFAVTAHGKPALSYKWQTLSGITWVDLSDVGRVSGALTDTLTITGALVADTGSYRCVITNGVSPDATTDTVTLTVNLAPVIDTQPIDTDKIQGETATFVVAAHGTPAVSYRWQVLSGTWTNLSDVGRVSGSGTATLTLTGVLADDAGSYRCHVSNGSLPDAYTNTVLLIMEIAIDEQPVSIIVNSQESATFTVVAIGIPPLRYQWRMNGANIAGANSSTFTIDIARLANVGSYTVVVNNDHGTVISDAAELTVLAVPIVIKQPPDVGTRVHDIITISVVVSASGTVTYQWYKYDSYGVRTTIVNYGRISGATSSILTITDASVDDEGYYICAISNNLGSVTTQLMTVIVSKLNPVTDINSSRITEVDIEQGKNFWGGVIAPYNYFS